jgi:hypothetical protein
MAMNLAAEDTLPCRAVHGPLLDLGAPSAMDVKFLFGYGAL